MKSVYYFILIVCLLGHTQTKAQTGKVLIPQPRNMNITGEAVSLKELYTLTGSMTPSARNLDLLKNLFNLSQNATAKVLEINQSSFDSFPRQVSGSYEIAVTKEKIQIDAFDQRGLFYALQTLLQLTDTSAQTRTLPLGKIIDYPAVAKRGTVEGFYGEPWTHEDRIRQLDFYGKFKLNTYIYGPKDDPYHSSPDWRKPYPKAEERRIHELVEAANKNYVDFVWAIHPGQDIQWNAEDSLAIIVKFEWMYQLGVRNFAVFFDDISGTGTDARKQAALLNYIDEAFMKPKKDAGFLMMCPTEYNKAWSNKEPNTYLDILGNTLRPNIDIMWTGNSVIADNTVEGLQWVNKRIKRKAFVWWNFPVSDYVRDHLLMGPAYGLEQGAAPYMSGFVSNPMDKSEASKVALVGVSWYAWNPAGYDSKAAWEAANKIVMPEAPKLFRFFNQHNSDLGPNGHGYRRAESERIAPTIESFTTALSRGNFKADDFRAIKAVFDSAVLAGEQIPAKSTNRRLIEQTAPWLRQFTYLGKAGRAAMQMLESRANKKMPAMWTAYLELDKYLDSMDYLDKHLNQNPYQPGVKTGSLVLTPFVKNMYERGNQILLTGKANEQTENKRQSSTLITDVEKLKNQPLLLTNEYVAISPVLEAVPMENAAFATLHIPDNLELKRLLYRFGGGKIAEKLQIQGSQDGQQWRELSPIDKSGKGEIDLLGQNLRYVRVVNTSGQKQSVFIRQFQLETRPVPGATATHALDGSLKTFDTLAANRDLDIELPTEMQSAPIRILTGKTNGTVEVTGFKKGFSRGKKIYTGKGGYILIPQSSMKKIKNVRIHNKSATPLKIYELQKQP